MRVIMLVGLAPRGDVAQRLIQGGLFVVSADDVKAALGILSAVRVDGFVIDVSDANVGGERLIARLRDVPGWREVPVVITGATPDQCERFAGRAFRGAIVTAREHGADGVLAALRPLLRPSAPLVDDVPGRSAWNDGGVSAPDVSTRTLRRWIAADNAMCRRFDPCGRW